MRFAPYQHQDDRRLDALREYGLQPDDGQAELQPIIDLAASLFGVPTVVVSIVEEHLTQFVARTGIDVCEVERDVSFCNHVLGLTDVLVIPDASLDPTFCRNPLVTGPAHLRFYAGAPLIAPSGHVIGSFCLIDTQSRNRFTAEEAANLKALAALALDKLELRRLERARLAGQRRFQQIAATSPDGIICADRHGCIRFWNAAAERLFGFSVDEAEGQPIDLIVPDRMRGGHGGGLKRVAAGGAPRLVGRSIELPAQRKDGSEFPIELSLSMWTEEGEPSFGAIIRDISERRASEDRLHRLAHLDPLTELPNRMVLGRRLQEIAAQDEAATLLAIDLDGFKAVNDTMGHSAGDRVLVEVAQRLLACVAATATVARLGGDEFAIIVPHTNDPLQASKMADCVIESLAKPFAVDGHDVHMGTSVGVALYPVHGRHAEDLLSAADLALYQAKAEGRHCRRFFTPGLRQAAILKLSQEKELRRAVEQGEFELFYQPQVRSGDAALVGAEALIRWRHPERGLLSPAAFLSALESGVLAADVGDWVLETACRQAKLWRDAGHRDFRMGVNLFGVQFRSGDLAATVRRVLGEAGLPPSALELEITENIILRHDEAMVGPLRELRDDGVGIAFDDYGTGYASLSLLKRYPLTRLKVDQTFVRGMCESKSDAAIVRAVVQLGKAFELEVIAEGVETQEQRDRLARKGCDELQGYLFGRPTSASEFTSCWISPHDTIVAA